MPERVLITGGAGFIGRHIGHALLREGHSVRAFDSLIEQVHGIADARPVDLDADIEFVRGDVRDSEAVGTALRGMDAVVHLAAEVGVGQSMYAVERYTSVNEFGTAVLLQRLLENPVRRVVVASSMSVYGEGLYRTQGGTLMGSVVRGGRNPDGSWDPFDSDGKPLIPMPTPETKQPSLMSVYAINKFVQERLTVTLTAHYGMESCALRLWNIYGPGQALSNPYTGVLAIFASRIANGHPPLVFEDGNQLRDFVHVSDVANAFCLALRCPEANGQVFNIGSGIPRTIAQVARLQAASMGRSHIEPRITQQARAGDVRHNIPKLARARHVLSYEARKDFSLGLEELSEWVARQAAHDRVDQAQRELALRGLVA